MCSPFYPAMQNYNKMKLKATTDYQVIRSPLYPDKYPSRYQCTWIISASKNTNKIKLNITDLKISNYKKSSCGSARIDVLQILIDGGSYSSPLLKQFCAPDSQTTVVSSAESLTVVFRTNYDNYFTGNTAGFEAKFIEIQEEIGNVL